MDNQARCSAFIEWKDTNDLSVLFIKHYYLTTGNRINIDAYTPQELYDGLKGVAKKVYRGKLKDGDIVFVKSNDTYIKAGLFIKEVEKDVSFLSLEVKVIAGQPVLSESLRLYTETCFLRPSEKEEEEIVEKKSKKK